MMPVHRHEARFRHEGDADDGDEEDDDLFDPRVGMAELEVQRQTEHEKRADPEGKAEEHFQRDGPAEELCQSRGDGGEHGRGEDEIFQPPVHVGRGRFGQAFPRDDAQVRRVVLKDDEHDRGERHHPEELVAVFRTGGDIRRPVAGIDETHRDDESRPERTENVQIGGELRLLFVPPVLHEIHFDESPFLKSEIYSQNIIQETAVKGKGHGNISSAAAVV